MRMNIKKTFYITWLALAVSGLSMRIGAQDRPVTPDQFIKVQDQIKAKLVEEQIPSMAVAVGKNGRILWESGFGWADRAQRIPASEHTIYSIGSVSKTLTATGLMVLVQRGSVGLDQPVNKYLGEAKLEARVGHENAATVRRLANHSSGLARYSTIIYDDEKYELPSMEESIRRYGILLREPGETYEYSNFGYSVLAYLIERTAASRFDDFMRKEVFVPLGMTHTAVGRGPGLEKFYAVSYTADQTPVPFHRSVYPGPADIYSSAHDLARFGIFHLRRLQPDQKKILEDRYIDAMQEPTMSIPGENGFGLRNNSYGIGWDVTPNRYGYRQIYHTGHDGYSTAILTLIPEEDICVAVLINGGNPASVVPVTDQILAALLPKYAGQMKQPVVREEQPTAQAYKPTEQLLGHWTGRIQTYAGAVPVEMWFKESGDVHVQLKGQLRTLLSGVRFENGYLRGSFSGDIGTPDANRRRPYNLHVKFKQRNDMLNGSITAATLSNERAGDVLSYWIELKRTQP